MPAPDGRWFILEWPAGLLVVIASTGESAVGLFSRRREKTSASAPDLGGLIVPILSGQAWVDANEQMFAQIPDFPAGSRPYAPPVAAGLYRAYAVDPGPSWEMVDADTARTMGGAEALEAQALANLRRRGAIRVEGGGGRYRLTVPDERDLSASLVLDAERWRSEVPIDGDLVVAVPTRVETLVCGAGDHESIAALRDLAERAFREGEGKPISPSLYRLSAAGLSLL